MEVDHSSPVSPSSSSTGGGKAQHEQVVSIRGQPVFLQEDWSHGIGGGLWSTGLALAKYLDTDHAQIELQRNPIKTVLELGSGNGFLGVCLFAACPSLEQIVVTDTKEHLPLMQSTIDSNPSLFPTEEAKAKVIVQEYLWGTGPLQLLATPTRSTTANTSTASAGTRTAATTFDLIIGSDLAYRNELHDPLIQALEDCSHSTTITLLGVTMHDTKPVFFSKLSARGFRYERLADHCMDPSFRGTSFGVFVIQR
jgi:predicted nicotinamide N-methyase